MTHSIDFRLLNGGHSRNEYTHQIDKKRTTETNISTMIHSNDLRVLTVRGLKLV